MQRAPQNFFLLSLRLILCLSKDDIFGQVEAQGDAWMRNGSGIYLYAYTRDKINISCEDFETLKAKFSFWTCPSSRVSRSDSLDNEITPVVPNFLLWNFHQRTFRDGKILRWILIMQCLQRNVLRGMKKKERKSLEQ